MLKFDGTILDQIALREAAFPMFAVQRAFRLIESTDMLGPAFRKALASLDHKYLVPGLQIGAHIHSNLLPTMAFGQIFSRQFEPLQSIIRSQLSPLSTQIAQRIAGDLAPLSQAIRDRLAIEVSPFLWSKCGYRTTTLAGIYGSAPGVASDVLRLYSNRMAVSGVFAQVMDGVVTADAQDDSRDATLEWLESALDTTLSLARRAPDIVVRSAYFQLASFLLTFAAVLIAYSSLAHDRQQDQSQSAFEERVTAELGLMSAEISTAIKQTRARDTGLRYVCAVTPLRTEPARAGHLIRRVYPDQIIRIVQVDGGWAKVEIFDYPAAQPVVGWISRRALRANPS